MCTLMGGLTTGCDDVPRQLVVGRGSLLGSLLFSFEVSARLPIWGAGPDSPVNLESAPRESGEGSYEIEGK